MRDHTYLRILRIVVTISFVWMCLLTPAVLFSEISKLVNDGQAFVSINTSSLQVGKKQSTSISENGPLINIDPSGDTVININYDGNITSSDVWLITASYGPQSLIILALIWLLWLVRAVTYTLGTNRVFSIENVRRIQGIGLLVVGIKLLSLTPWWLTKAYIIDTLSSHHIQFTTNSNYTLLNEVFLGVLIIGLAEVFRQGMTLKEEQALTI
ncbi:DUF2975 domain-containing protein [Spirosoma pomorum]